MIHHTIKFSDFKVDVLLSCQYSREEEFLIEFRKVKKLHISFDYGPYSTVQDLQIPFFLKTYKERLIEEIQKEEDEIYKKWVKYKKEKVV